MSETDAIYPKEKLLIRQGMVVTPVWPTLTNTPVAALTAKPTQAPLTSPTIVSTVTVASAAPSSTMLGIGVLVMAVLLMVGIMLPGVRQSDEHRRAGW